MLGRHIILNRAITEDPMKRLPLNIRRTMLVSLEEDSGQGDQHTKILSRRLPGMSEAQQGQYDRRELNDQRPAREIRDAFERVEVCEVGEQKAFTLSEMRSLWRSE